LAATILIMSYAHMVTTRSASPEKKKKKKKKKKKPTLFVNGATLAAIPVEDYAPSASFCPSTFCRIGKYSYIAANTFITQDVPPFSKIVAPADTKSMA